MRHWIIGCSWASRDGMRHGFSHQDVWAEGLVGETALTEVQGVVAKAVDTAPGRVVILAVSEIGP
jgi:hypothetical protein